MYSILQETGPTAVQQNTQRTRSTRLLIVAAMQQGKATLHVSYIGCTKMAGMMVNCLAILDAKMILNSVYKQLFTHKNGQSERYLYIGSSKL